MGLLTRARAVAGLAGLVAIVLISLSANTSVGPRARVIRFSAAYPVLSVADLAAAADAIAVIEPQGGPLVHWNSSDGREWVSTDRDRPAYIYSDERVELADVITGQLKGTSLVIRTPGGRVDPVTMTFENAPSWQAGRRYLAFLDLADTPTQVGFEPFWSILWMDRGLFQADAAGIWRNDAAGLSVGDPGALGDRR